jgi:hypothetical protein
MVIDTSPRMENIGLRLVRSTLDCGSLLPLCASSLLRHGACGVLAHGEFTEVAALV